MVELALASGVLLPRVRTAPRTFPAVRLPAQGEPTPFAMLLLLVCHVQPS